MAANFQGALSLLHELKQRDPDDAVASLYIARCEAFQISKPEAGWCGYHKYVTK
jgi:hypothetical protein